MIDRGHSINTVRTYSATEHIGVYILALDGHKNQSAGD